MGDAPACSTRTYSIKRGGWVHYSVEFGKVLSRIIIEGNVTGTSRKGQAEDLPVGGPGQNRQIDYQCPDPVGLVAIPPTASAVGFPLGGS